MESFRIKQILLAFCLMAALVTASPAACVCSHHEEAKAVVPDCHSHHDADEAVETDEVANAVDESCVCYVNERSPYVASTTAGKELRPADAVVEAENIVAANPDFTLVATLHISSPTFADDVSYSHTLRSLLPARAPPRL